jgi:hypothetical protein
MRVVDQSVEDAIGQRKNLESRASDGGGLATTLVSETTLRRLNLIDVGYDHSDSGKEPPPGVRRRPSTHSRVAAEFSSVPETAPKG